MNELASIILSSGNVSLLELGIDLVLKIGKINILDNCVKNGNVEQVLFLFGKGKATNVMLIWLYFCFQIQKLTWMLSQMKYQQKQINTEKQ